jgi:hypothetical protein
VDEGRSCPVRPDGRAATLQVAALDRVDGERQRRVVRLLRLVAPAEPGEQVGPHDVERVGVHGRDGRLHWCEPGYPRCGSRRTGSAVRLDSACTNAPGPPPRQG